MHLCFSAEATFNKINLNWQQGTWEIFWILICYFYSYRPHQFNCLGHLTSSLTVLRSTTTKQPASNTLIQLLIISCMGYCNSIFPRLPTYPSHIYAIQNHAPYLLSSNPYQSHIKSYTVFSLIFSWSIMDPSIMSY